MHRPLCLLAFLLEFCESFDKELILLVLERKEAPNPLLPANPVCLCVNPYLVPATTICKHLQNRTKTGVQQRENSVTEVLLRAYVFFLLLFLIYQGKGLGFLPYLEGDELSHHFIFIALEYKFFYHVEKS